MAARDDVDAPLIAVLGFVGALLVFLLIIGLEVLDASKRIGADPLASLTIERLAAPLKTSA